MIGSQDLFRQTTYSIKCRTSTKDMASSIGIYVRILSTFVPSSMHLTPGLKPGFWCQAPSKLLYSLSCTKDLASSYGFDVQNLSDSCYLSCTKDLTSSQAFDARIGYCWTIVQPDSEFVYWWYVLNNHLSGSYFLALTRKINLVTEFCAHLGRGRGCRGEGLGWDGERNWTCTGGGRRNYLRHWYGK